MARRMFIPQEDLNRIDVISSEDIFIRNEQLLSVGNFDKTNRRKSVTFSPFETIELEENVRSKSSPSSLRVQTPTSKSLRRWSVNMTHFSKDQPSKRKESIFRQPSRKLFEDDGDSDPSNPEIDIEQLVKDIEQYDYLMQFNPLSARSRLKVLRILPQPIFVKRLLKRHLFLTMEQQKLTESPTFRDRVIKYLLNFVFSILLHVYNLQIYISNSLKFWNQSVNTIEAQFGSNASSYFKFLRCLFTCNLVLFIFPLIFITLPQILYNDDVIRRHNDQFSIGVDFVMKYSDIYKLFKIPGDDDQSAMDFLTGEGMLGSSLMFYASYSNVTFSYRDLKSTYNIPNAYYMTMLMLYLTVFVTLSSSVARSYRKSYIKASYNIRNLYATKVCFAWNYRIADEKAADLKHFSIYTELKEVLRELHGCKTKQTHWPKFWTYSTQTIAHILVFAIIAAAGLIVWIILNEYDKRSSNDSSWDALFSVTFVNLTLHISQIVLSWISSMEDYRSPRRTLLVSLVRNFLLESAVVAVILYYWTTKNHVEGWETLIGQEMYRLIISDCFIRLLIIPMISCFRVFILIRLFPILERPDFDISFKSVGLVYNQTLLWIGLFFAPLLAGIMIIKLILLFHINKATITHLCKSPRHIWRSSQTHTLYLLFSFLSLVVVIITLGYTMTRIPASQLSGPFRDQSLVFHIFIHRVLCLSKDSTVWSILMFIIRPGVVAGIFILMSITVYFLRVKARAYCNMAKSLKEMIYLQAKEREYLLAQLTQIAKNRKSNFKTAEEEEVQQADMTDDLITESSPTWQYSGGSKKNNETDDSKANFDSPKTVLRSVDECILRNRNV